MNQDTNFEAGRRIGHIESFYRTSTEKSTRLLVMAEQGNYESIYETTLSGNYGTLKEFMNEVELYKKEVQEKYKEYSNLREKFPKLAYFNNKINIVKLELDHEIALSALEKAISILKKPILKQ